MANTFGQLFRVTTFGESHGGGIGIVIDGCPPKIDISPADIQRELDRRRPGQSKITTQRKEEDRCEIVSGIFDGKTLGMPILVMRRNTESVTGRAAVARRRVRRLPASPPAQSRKRYWQSCTRISRSSVTSRRFTTSSRRSIVLALR